jgi:hypothetical protein
MGVAESLEGTRQVRLLHTHAKGHPAFDDPNLVSHADLMPVMALAQRAGLVIWSRSAYG